MLLVGVKCLQNFLPLMEFFTPLNASRIHLHPNSLPGCVWQIYKLGVPGAGWVLGGRGRALGMIYEELGEEKHAQSSA